MNKSESYLQEVKKLLNTVEIDDFSFELNGEFLNVIWNSYVSSLNVYYFPFVDDSHDPKKDAQAVLTAVKENVRKTKEVIKIYEKIYEISDNLYDEFVKRPDYGKTWQFNIKLHGNFPEIPEKYKDKVTDDDFWEFLNEELGVFVDALREKFSWIKDWRGEGRMGGWLILKDFELGYFDKIDIPSELDIFLQSFDYDELEEAKSILKTWEQREEDLNEIKNMIHEGQKNLQSRYESFLKDVFEES